MISNLELFKKVADEVYGSYVVNTPWIPKPYKEGKGRYLWTDAFGVCNFVTLYYETGENRYLDQADCLIQNVHDTLGKDRQGKSRLGNATNEQPLKGGLRIGKEDPEGTPDGDGQYFHYLTKWMFALNRMSLARSSQKYNEWAIQLAEAVHSKFVHAKGQNHLRMYWKMSIDLSKPHVHSEGNLDPYDGLVTYKLLRETSLNKDILAQEIEDMTKMVNSKYLFYRSDDPLDLGEALWLAHFFPEEEWSKALTARSIDALDYLWKSGAFLLPDRYRLAFREFGTTIGVQINPKAGSKWVERALDINKYWSKNLYSRDKDITPVMYCSSLIPGVFDNSYYKIPHSIISWYCC